MSTNQTARRTALVSIDGAAFIPVPFHLADFATPGDFARDVVAALAWAETGHVVTGIREVGSAAPGAYCGTFNAGRRRIRFAFKSAPSPVGLISGRHLAAALSSTAMVPQQAQQQQADAGELPPGYRIEQDDDGDWLLVPPAAVTIFSAPGEPILIGKCSRKAALSDARDMLRDIAHGPAMVPMPVQQQQARDARHAKGILSPGCIPERPSTVPASLSANVVMQWADEAVKARPFGYTANRGECHRDETCGVRLIQRGRDRFTVVYGRQVKDDLTYAQAASEYGLAVMHALACEGMLDNRERGER